MSAYFDRLAAHLREGGVPDDQVAVTIGDLETYVADTGGDPEAEFGPVPEFARRLFPEAEGAEEAAAGERWRWRADAFSELRKLAAFGDQGWEVERVDGAGRFVCRRDPENTQRWEYRRELADPGRAADLAARLAPDGWEPCGTWVVYAYFKRPKAASIGPEAAIDRPEGRPVRATFFGVRFYLFLAGWLALVAAAVVAAMVLGDEAVGGHFAVGVASGAVAALVGTGAVVAWKARRAGRE